MENVYFKPWVGSNYKDAVKKILVIGDSHYCGACQNCGVRGYCSIKEMGDCVNFTSNVVREYLDFLNGKKESDMWMRSFKCFDKILLGQDATKEERTEMWNGIAFYNFVQTAISGVTSNAKYTQKDYVDSSAMALEIIKELHPDYVIVWGKRAYNYLPDTDWLSEDKAYLLPNGHKVYCLRIDHPSRAHQATWSKEVKKFLEK